MSTALTEVFARFRADVDDRAIKKGEKSTGKLIATLGKLAAVVGTGALIHGMKNFTLKMVGQIDEIDKSSRALSLNSDTLQEFRFAADRSGVSAEKLGMAMGLVQQKALDASRGSAEVQKDFDALNVTLKDGEGQLKSVDALLSDMADGFKGLTNPTEKTALAMKLFGRSGKQLIPFLDEGSEGITALRERFRELGGGFSEDLIGKGAEAKDALTDLRAALTGFKSNIALTVLPAVKGLALQIADGVKWFREVTKNVDLTRVGLVALAVVGVPAALAALSLIFSPAGAVIAGAVLLGLLVEDLITAFKGGKSVIAEWFQSWFDYPLIVFLDQVVIKFYDLQTTVSVFAGIAQVAIGNVIMVATSLWSVLGGILKVVAGITSGLGKLAGMAGLSKVADALGKASSAVKGVGHAAQSGGRLGGSITASGIERLGKTGETFRANRESALSVIDNAQTSRAKAAFAERERRQVEAGVQSGALRTGATPPSSKGSTTNNTTINVNGANRSPQEIAREVQKAVASEMRKGSSQ